MPIGGFISDLLGPTVSNYITPALEGAATGAIGNLATGGDPLKGALVGGVTGAGIGAFGGADGALAQALGLTGPQVNALIGAGGGALGYGLTGQNPLLGGALGGIGGYLYGGPNANQTVYDTAGNPVSGGPNAPAGTDPGLVDKNGNAITPPIPPEGGAPSMASQTAAGGGGGAVGHAAANILGGTGGLKDTQLILGALAAMGAANSKPKQGTWTTPGPAQNPNVGPLFTAALPGPGSVPGRTAVNPWAGNPAPAYWNYGGPEQTYFTGNTTHSYGFADGGGAIAAGLNDNDDYAHGGEFSTANGQHYVQGAGDGQSDSIPARLADGEYVLTAQEVALLGQGSNRAGAKRLDKFRDDLKRKAGAPKFLPRGLDGELHSLAVGKGAR